MAYCIHFKHFILPQFNAFSSIWHGFYTKSLYFFTLVHCLWKHLQHSLLCIVDKFIMYAQWNAICIFHGSPVNPIISNVSIMVRPYSTTVACDCIHGMSWHVNTLCTVKPDMLYNRTIFVFTKRSIQSQRTLQYFRWNSCWTCTTLLPKIFKWHQ